MRMIVFGFAWFSCWVFVFICFIAGFMMGFHWFLFEHWDSDLLLWSVDLEWVHYGYAGNCVFVSAGFCAWLFLWFDYYLIVRIKSVRLRTGVTIRKKRFCSWWNRSLSGEALGFMCPVDTVLSELDSISMCVAGFHWFGVCVYKHC